MKSVSRMLLALGLLAMSTLPALASPTAYITANGQSGSVTVNEGTNVRIAISTSEAPAGAADWWMAYTSSLSSNFYVFNLNSGWVANTWAATYTGVLSDAFFTPPITMMNAPLPVGDYTYYFGVDLTPDGNLTIANLSFNSVTVHVREAATAGECGFFPGAVGSSWTMQGTGPDVGGTLAYEKTVVNGSAVTLAQTLTSPQGVLNSTIDYQVNCNQANMIRNVMHMPGFSITANYNPPLLVSPAQFTPAGHQESSSSTVTTSLGCTYNQTNTFEILGPETVTVPAGTFNAVKVRFTTATPAYTCNFVTTPAQTIVSTNWFAAGIGFVKSTDPENNTELVSYSIR